MAFPGDLVAATAPSTPVVEVDALVRRFGRRRALNGVSLSVQSGECLAVFGPNGAGKSTLLRVLAGLLEPTGGSAFISGMRLPGDAAVRAQIGFVSHDTMLYPTLTARENVVFAARLYGLGDPTDAADRALARLGVLDRATTLVGTLSRGLQQRVAIARASVHDPRLLLLDEPYTALDVNGTAALSELLADLTQRGAASILVTQHLAEGLALATHVAVMHVGRIVRYEPRAAIEPEAYAAGYRDLVAIG